ncbi:MAG TPA: hypothetical protein PK961_00055 [bacterium]|nr:hypothetical protein [bacterium]
MKKAIIILTAICFLLSGFALMGCGKKEEPAPVQITPKPAPKPAEPIAVKPAEPEKSSAPVPPEKVEMKKKPKSDKKPAKVGGLKKKK